MKKHILAAALAAFFMLPVFSTVAYAGGGDYTESEFPATYELAPPIPATEGPVITEAEIQPFTPAGTGTVVDNATNEDGKEFFTIMTPDENVFFLVIDRQRGQENVYFLNAVTEADLLSLAKLPERPVVEQAPAPAEPEPEPTPPAPEKSGGMGTLLLVVLIVIVGGGAGYYFKIYRPKQQQADNGDEYEAGDEYEGGEYDPYGGDEYGAEPEADDPAWYDGDEGDGEV